MPIVGCIYRRVLSGHYSQHSLATTTWEGERASERALMVSCSCSSVSIVMPVTQSVVKHGHKRIYAIAIFFSPTVRDTKDSPLWHYKEWMHTLYFTVSCPPPSLFLPLPNSSSAFSHLCIQDCIPRFSTIWRLNSSLLVAMKGMLNTALMCNLSLHKHYRSWPTPGINATDLSYTSRAQLEEMGVGGGWVFEGDLFNLNLNLHRALCKCEQADIFPLSGCLNTKCSWQNQDAFYRGGRIQVCGR